MSVPEATPEAIRRVLKSRGWTQVHASKLLQMSPETFRRYVMTDGKSKLSMPPHLWTLLLLYAGLHPKWMLTPRQAAVDYLSDDE